MRIAIVGDIHIRNTHRDEDWSIFASLKDEADILVLCGDLTYSGSIEEAEQLAKYLDLCKVPTVAVLGNHDYHHDNQDGIKKALASQIVFLEDQPFQKDGVSFVGTKGFGGGFDKHMLSLFGEKATKAFVTEAVNESLKLENDLHSITTEKIIVALHYSPVVDTVRGEPEEIFPFLGCSRLAETIDRFPVSLVAHGHAHLGAHEGKTAHGIPVYNCALEVVKRTLNKPYKIITV